MFLFILGGQPGFLENLIMLMKKNKHVGEKKIWYCILSVLSTDKDNTPKGSSASRHTVAVLMYQTYTQWNLTLPV